MPIVSDIILDRSQSEESKSLARLCTARANVPLSEIFEIIEYWLAKGIIDVGV